MIEDFQSRQDVLQVLRLWSLPKKPLSVQLLERNIAPEDLEDVLSTIQPADAPMTAEEAVNATFARKTIEPQRYNNSTFSALYTALERETCLAEIQYHVGPRVEKSAPRYYQFISITFNGNLLDLCGYEAEYPNLVSVTEVGYPFCQTLAVEAKAAGHHALHAPSARSQNGKCVPIFYRANVSEISSQDRIRFALEGGALTVTAA